MTLFRNWVSNSQIKVKQRKLWSFLSDNLRTCMICSWLKVNNQTMRMPCSIKNICAATRVPHVRRIWQTCMERKLSSCLGVSCQCATHLRELLALVKASVRCFQWSSQIRSQDTAMLKTQWPLTQTFTLTKCSQLVAVKSSMIWEWEINSVKTVLTLLRHWWNVVELTWSKDYVSEIKKGKR